MLHDQRQQADITYQGFVLTRTIESTYMYYRYITEPGVAHVEYR